MVPISVIVPVYGVEKYVERCIRSVMAQANDFPGMLECVIVNDCTQDGSMDVITGLLNEYEGSVQFRIVEHDVNLGLSEARNTGIRAATCDFIIFLDGDDELTPGAILSFAQKIEEYPDIDMIVGAYVTDADSKHLKIRIKDDYLRGLGVCKKAFLRESLFPDTAHNKLVFRRFILDNGLYFKSGIYHEDNLWKWHCAKYVGSVAFLRNPTMIYNDTHGSISNKPVEKRMESLLAIMEEKIDTIDEYDPESQLLNAVFFLHQIDDRSRSVTNEAYYNEIKKRIKTYAGCLRVKNKAVSSMRVSLSLFLLKMKQSLPFDRSNRVFHSIHVIARRIAD